MGRYSLNVHTLSAICGLVALGLPLSVAGQEAHKNRKPELPAYVGVRPWTEGSVSDAATQSAVSATIPMSNYVITASKDGKSYTGTIVGGSPFSSSQGTTTTNAVVVPLKISIGSATFDPTVADSCNGVAASSAFQLSPLVQATPITFNGTPLTAQYIDGFRQAEFSSIVSSSYSNPIVYTFASPYVISSGAVGRHGITYSSGCSLLGILSYSWLDSYLRSTVMPSLTRSGVISPTALVIFLVKNVVQSTTNPPRVSSCCILGYHGATGSPVQTYSPVDWDTTGLFGAGVHDASIASHEIGEWMDDPLGNNPTPAWGGIGQVSSCQNNLEVGDALTGSTMPNGAGYTLQELAFFSWFYNSPATPSLGAGGKFSSNGSFAGPSKACPPGGTN